MLRAAPLLLRVGLRRRALLANLLAPARDGDRRRRLLVPAPHTSPAAAHVPDADVGCSTAREQQGAALRELHRSQRMHMEKLRNMKPGIDMKRPEQPKFLQYNAKRVQMEKERNLTIERENKILLGKMYSIMNSEPAYKTTQHKTISLNMSIRKQEYDRIARENQAIMQRILQREPEFDRARLDREWKETQRYLRTSGTRSSSTRRHRSPLPRRSRCRRSRVRRPTAPGARRAPSARARLTALPSHLRRRLGEGGRRRRRAAGVDEHSRRLQDRGGGGGGAGGGVQGAGGRVRHGALIDSAPIVMSHAAAACGAPTVTVRFYTSSHHKATGALDSSHADHHPVRVAMIDLSLT